MFEFYKLYRALLYIIYIRILQVFCKIMTDRAKETISLSLPFIVPSSTSRFIGEETSLDLYMKSEKMKNIAVTDYTDVTREVQNA
jgi:hypothetical protein